MTSHAPRRPVRRVVLISVLVLALIVLGVIAAIVIPILTHSNTGSSGQQLPAGFVAKTSAEGADGRTRTLEASAPEGRPAELGSLSPGDEIVVRGDGFNAGAGIYIGFCALPETPEKKPGPCLGGVPEGAEQGDAAGLEALSSAWITSDWAWRAFATQGYDDTKRGTFSVRLTVPEPVIEGLDCTVTQCVLATRSDHTAMKERVQDMMLPIAYRAS